MENKLAGILHAAVGGERVEGREEKVEPVTGRDVTPNGSRPGTPVGKMPNGSRFQGVFIRYS